MKLVGMKIGYLYLETQCKNCGKSIIDIQSKNRKFCSKKCTFKYAIGENNPNWRGGVITKICPICKKVTVFSNRSNGKKSTYCRPCSYTATALKLRKRVNVRCIVCGKVFEISKVKGERRKTCGFKCMAEYFKTALLAHKNPNWKKGSSFEPYPTTFNSALKNLIRSKFGYRCAVCLRSSSELGYKLHVHHIDYNKLNISENNLIALCRNCHVKTNGRREYHASWLRKVIKNFSH